MKDYLLIFRRDFSNGFSQLSAEQLQAMTKPWQEWMGNLAARNKLSNSGNRLANEGKVVKPNNVVTDGPYIEIKEAIGGYIIIKAVSLEEAAEIAKSCPILQVGGNVEVRGVVEMSS